MTNEELAVAVQQTGDQSLIVELWNQCEKFIRACAYGWIRHSTDAAVDVDDLTQSGYFALVYAIRAYDPAAGFKFLTYLNRPLKTAFNTALGRRTSKRDASQFAISIDAPVANSADDDASNLLSFIPDTSAEIAFEQTVEHLAGAQIGAAIDAAAKKHLSKRQRAVYREHVHNDKSFDAIAQEWGIHRQTIGAIWDAVLWKLHADDDLRKLYEDVLDEDVFDWESEIWRSTSRKDGVSDVIIHHEAWERRSKNGMPV